VWVRFRNERMRNLFSEGMILCGRGRRRIGILFRVVFDCAVAPSCSRSGVDER